MSFSAAGSGMIDAGNRNRSRNDASPMVRVGSKTFTESVILGDMADRLIREAGLRALHRRYRPGDYETWKYIAPIQKAAWLRKSFEYGTWGGEIRPRVRA